MKNNVEEITPKHLNPQRVHSIPKFYDKDRKFVDFPVDIRVNEKFVLIGTSSTPDPYLGIKKDKSKGIEEDEPNPHELNYYWRLINGNPPQIVESAPDGSHVKFISPKVSGIIEFQLKVVDKFTKNASITKFQINVLESHSINTKDS